MADQSRALPETMRAWRVHRYGKPSTALQLDDIPVPQPQAGEVLVRVRSAALNFNEIDGCYGRYITINPPTPYTLGMEVMGEVAAAGPGAETWLGRRVVASARWAFGGYADYVIADAGNRRTKIGIQFHAGKVTNNCACLTINNLRPPGLLAGINAISHADNVIKDAITIEITSSSYGAAGIVVCGGSTEPESIDSVE